MRNIRVDHARRCFLLLSGADIDVKVAIGRLSESLLAESDHILCIDQAVFPT